MKAILVFLLLLPVSVWSNNHYDSLNNVVSISSGEAKINAMIALSDRYEENRDLLNAEKVLNEAIRYIQDQRTSMTNKEKLEIQVMLHQASLSLFSTADYKKSISLLLKILNHSKKINDTSSILQANLYLGFNYRFLQRYHESIQFLDQAIALASLAQDTITLVTAMNEKANDYYFLKETDQSKKLRIEALELAKISGNLNEERFISHDLAILFVDSKEYRKALVYFLLAYQNSVKENVHRQIAIIAVNVSDAYLNLNINDSALMYLNEADAVTKQHNLPYERSLVYHGFSQYYHHVGNHPLAFDYLTQYLNLTDTIFNLEKERQIAEITTRFQSDKKDQENLLLKQKFRNTLIIGSISTIFILAFILLLALNIRKRRIVNYELARRNDTISNQKENLSVAFDMLRRREKELEDANQAKDVFFSIIAHDLKSPFNALLGFSNLLRDEYDSFSPEETKRFIGNIADSSENIYLLLENLLAWSRTQTNRIVVNLEPFDLAEKIKSSVDLLSPLIQKKQITVHFKSLLPVMIRADKGMIDFVIRNLLSNAIKYVNRGGEIRIVIDVLKNKATVAIIDNGVGISSENLPKLFRIDSKIKTYGTENETGTGLGLIVCKEFIEKLGGEIWAESTEGTGSRFCFSIMV